MTDEEKKAIEEQYKEGLVNLSNVIEPLINQFKVDYSLDIQQCRLIINYLLMERDFNETYYDELDKEIEELKEELDRQINVRMINEEYLEKNFISKEKIKEKVEEIKKYKDLARDSIEERIVIADRDSLNYGRKEAHEKDIKVLQSLLEKE